MYITIFPPKDLSLTHNHVHRALESFREVSSIASELYVACFMQIMGYQLAHNNLQIYQLVARFSYVTIYIV